MNKSVKIFTVLGITAVLAAGYVWGIPAIVNLPSRKDFIEQKILENTGIKTNIGSPVMSMGFLPSVWIETDNISVINNDKSKALSIDNVKFKVKLLPLFFKKIEIAKFSSTKEDVKLVLTKNKEFLLGDYPLKFDNKNKKIKFASIDLNLGEYNVSLDDELNNQKVKLTGDYFSNGLYEHNNNIKFATQGNFEIGNKNTPYFADVDISLPIKKFHEDKFKIFGKIENFDLASISDYVSILSGGLIQKMSGKLNIASVTKNSIYKNKVVYSNITTEKLNIQGKDEVSKIQYQDKLSLKLNFETVDGGFDFKNTTLNANNIHASVNGKLTGIGADKPSFHDFEIEVKDTRLEDVCKIMPWARNLVREMDFYALKKHVFYGDGNGKLTFNGKGRYPHVNGKVELRNGYLIHSIKGAPSGAEVDLTFKGQVMDVDVYVPVSKTQNVSVKGFAKTDGSKYSELDIKSTNSIDMATAHEVLIPLHEILKFKLGPLPIMKMSGLGGIQLRSAGKKVDPHLFGEVKFRNATASFNQIHNLVLTNGSGEVIFDDTNINFKTYTGLINGQKTEIDGTSTVLGKLNVNAKTQNQNITDILKVINTSADLADVQRVLKPFTKPYGKADLLLNIYGEAKDIEKVEFNKDLFAKGTVTLHNAVTTLKDTYLPLTKINGVVNFKEKDADYNLDGYVRNSKVYVKGTANDKIMDLKAESDNFVIADCFDLLYPKMILPYKNEIGKMKVSFNGGYNGIADSDNLDYSKVKVNGKILSNMNSSNPIKIHGGDFTINNGILNASGLKGLFNGNFYNLSFTATDIYDKMEISHASFDFKDFNIAAVENIKENVDMPPELKKILDNITGYQGTIDIKGNIKNGKINSDTNLDNISFIYKPYDAVVRILNGKANIRNNNLYLGKVNSRISSMPVFIDGSISDILNKQYVNLYLSAKPTQMFFDRFFNTKSVYPIKIKGDVNFNANIKGTLEKLHAKSTLDVKENSYLYYMGATLSGAPTGTSPEGEITTNPIKVSADTVIYPNKIRINSMNYNQIIPSQNYKASVQNQLISSGEISILKNNVFKFNNFKVKTNAPTDARIFNILLKKPTIKQGVFNTDITINGTSLAPEVNGDLNITSVDIPLLDATIRDISINFLEDLIDLKAKGIILTNDINLEAKISNKVTPPYVIEDALLQMDVLDLNIIGNALNDFDADKIRNDKINSSSNTPTITPDQIILKNLDVIADKILIKKAQATDFKAKANINSDHIANVENYSFNLANGIVNGNIKYDLNNYNGTAKMSIKNADAEIISENFFDMPGQMYGNVTGDLDVSCNGISSVDCLKTLSGSGNFDVSNGRMPKLGSLEYLLKAGNLITGGVTGVSINGIIDLITPLKTGEFESISGDIKVENGVADEINVYSSGKDLNMYLTGSYNLLNLVADMEIYGSLSADFSSLLGLIRNMSLNRLLNTIPGIKINEVNPKSTSNINKIPNFDKSKVLRVFKAEIFGDINGTNYVKSFHWIRH